MDKHLCLKEQLRDTDYFAGILPLVINIPNGDWSPYLPPFDRQKIGFESDGCVPFSAVESVEIQMNFLIKTGKLPQGHLDYLNQAGFINSDGQFDASERFIAKMDNTDANGTALTSPWDAMRKYGLLSQKDWPFDQTVTDWNTFYETVPQVLLDKAVKFLDYFSFYYKWVVNKLKQGTDAADMKKHIVEAPLCIGHPACLPWNQMQPPICSSAPTNHSTTVYKMDAFTHILDHYDPFLKQFAPGYFIPYALKGVLNIVPPRPVSLPQESTPIEKENWILQALRWIWGRLLNYA